MGGQPGRQRSSRGFVSGRRCLLVERFVGALDIELGSEPIEASLLASQCGGGRTRRFLLERLVHALVPSVLLGMAGLDELWVDAHANPPDGESAQSPDGRRRKGHPFAGPNPFSVTLVRRGWARSWPGGRAWGLGDGAVGWTSISTSPARSSSRLKRDRRSPV